MTIRFALLAPAMLLAACTGGQGHDATVPGDAQDKQPYSGVAAGDVVRFVGTEPFWGGDVMGDRLTWTTPEQPEGQAIPVTRFAGRGGISFTGRLDDHDFTLTLTEAPCSDGMSDRTYTFAATVSIGTGQLLNGCGWTDARPYAEGAQGAG